MLLCFRELANKIECVLGRHLAVLFPLNAGEFDGGHRHCALGHEPNQLFLGDAAATHAW